MEILPNDPRELLAIVCVCAFALTTTTTRSTERFVPQGGSLNYPSIQAAISAAAAGDIIRVQPGTYRESIRFGRFDITVTSLNPLDASVVRSTVIEGDGTNSVVSFTAGQTTNALLTGFTIRSGGGTVLNVDVLHFIFGGGIYCNQSSPSIVGNVIEDNRLATNRTAITTSGGGIACLGGAPRIARNIFRNNAAYTGGAIHSDGGSPMIEDNWIYSNLAVLGGGAFLVDQGQFINNTLFANSEDNMDVETTTLVMNNIISFANSGIGMAVGPRADKTWKWFLFNDLWGNPGGDILKFSEIEGRADRLAAGVPIPIMTADGNRSVDPHFVSASDLDFHLLPDSLCINAGDTFGFRSSQELDIDGQSRRVALRADLGAAEVHDNLAYPPMAQVGTSRTVDWNLGEALVLDGTASIDPLGKPLQYAWQQISGSAVALLVANASATFTPTSLGEYAFELVVNNGVYDSLPSRVQILVTNLPPIASAGSTQNWSSVPTAIVLDGSHSLDPEGQALAYDWHQISGPPVQLTSSQSTRASFEPREPGVYEFELIVRDAFQASLPSRITHYVGQVPPVANAGSLRYAGRSSVMLDGSASFAPNNPVPLQFSWRQVTGPMLTMLNTNTAHPSVSGFHQLTNQTQEATFELIVRAGECLSAPAIVKIVIVPAWKNTTLVQLNPPFDPAKPTVVGFSGGNCDSGDAMNFPASWRGGANLFSCSYNRNPDSPVTARLYSGYADQLLTILSGYAPDYNQPIQTIGWSTGCMPACDVAERLNTVYQDSRYLVNRLTFLDSACRDYSTNIDSILSHRVPGKHFWIDNYYALAGMFRPDTLNVQFPVPPADHNTPNNWYFPSWNVTSTNSVTNLNDGVIAGAFFSVLGPGKHLQLETSQSDYSFGWTSTKSTAFPFESMVRLSPIACPARLPGLVELQGPTNRSIIQPGSAIFSCLPVLNAVSYQVLLGPAVGQEEQVVWEGPTPPSLRLADFPFGTTYWTVRAADAYGTTSEADPRIVYRDSDGDGLSDEAELYTYRTNPNNPDTDGDGRLDGDEVQAGTDPLSPVDPLVVHASVLSAEQLQFRWFAEHDRIYELEFTPSLPLASWTIVETIPAPASSGLVQRTVTRPPGVSGFYRLHAPY